MPKFIVAFAPQMYTTAAAPENQADYAPEPREFHSRELAANYLNSYWFDEWQEAQGNPAAPSQPALYRAFARTYEGFAQGGDFEVEFFGDKATVEVRYVSMGEALCEFAQAELAYIHDDMPAEERPGDSDVGMAIAELVQALPMFGEPMAEWRMLVEPGCDEPHPDFVPSNASVSVPYYVNGPRLQMPCAMGRVTFWPQ